MVRVAIFLVLLTILPSVAQAKRVALVVGINRYDNLPRDRQLRKAVNDAQAVGNALRTVGFEVISAENVTRRDFNEKWQQMLGKVSPGDEVAVFFSGHGIEIDGANYLVPRDVPAVRSGETQRLKSESLNFDDLRRALANQGPRLSLFILDACRDNPFTDTRGRSIGGSKGLVPVQVEQGSFIMYSAGTRQTALDRLSDSDSNPNSVYTRKLLPLLTQRGLRLPELAQRLRIEVRDLANSVGHLQTPAYYDETTELLCLAGCPDAVQAASPVTPRPPDCDGVEATIGNGRRCIKLVPTAAGCAAPGTPRVAIRVYKYATTTDDEKRFIDLYRIIGGKLKILKYELQTTETGGANFKYLDQLHVSPDNEAQEFLTPPNSLEEMLSEWKQQDNLILLSGNISVLDGRYDAISYIFWGELKPPDMREQIKAEMSISAAGLRDAIDSHSFIALFALAMDAKVRKCPPELVFYLLDKTIEKANDLKERGLLVRELVSLNNFVLSERASLGK
jgi:hypothetical protein